MPQTARGVVRRVEIEAMPARTKVVPWTKPADGRRVEDVEDTGIVADAVAVVEALEAGGADGESDSPCTGGRAAPAW